MFAGQFSRQTTAPTSHLFLVSKQKEKEVSYA